MYARGCPLGKTASRDGQTITQMDRSGLDVLVKRGMERTDPPNLHYGKPFPWQLRRVQLYPYNCWGVDMADIHFHVWHYQRDPDGVIRSMARRPERYE